MNTETQISTITQLMEGLLEDQPSYFLVDIRIKPTNNIKVYLDGDQGITIEKCIAFNRALYKKLEELALFPADDFSLEISSPGLDEPLKLRRQYQKNIGRPVEVLLKDGQKLEGKLMELSEEAIVLEENTGKMIKGKPPGKNKAIKQHTILFDHIKSTKLQIVF